MLLKAVILELFVQFIYGYQEKYVIENKQIGEVLEDVEDVVLLAKWNYKDSQLWTLEPQNESGYFVIRNFETGRDLTCLPNVITNTEWTINTYHYTRIMAESSTIFLKQSKNIALCSKSKQNDESDIWSFIKKSQLNRRPVTESVGTGLVIDDSRGYREKYVIENKQTGRVLDHIEGVYLLAHWRNRDSQLWTLESQNKSKYFMICNFGSRLCITCSGNDTSYDLWTINTKEYTRITSEHSTFFLDQRYNLMLCYKSEQDGESDIWLFIEQSQKINMKFVIESVRTGLVIDEGGDELQMTRWRNTNSQLWTLEPKGRSGYFIVNVATGYRITCNGNNIWQLNSHGETRIEVKHPNIFLTSKNVRLLCTYNKTSHDNDRWLFIQQSRKVNTKFVIKNKKTGTVLEEAEEALKIGAWQYRERQLWTLEPQGKSGYSIINAVTGNALTFSENGVENQVWTLHTRGYTMIQVEDPNVNLANKNGKPVYIKYIQDDESDRWKLIERDSIKTNVKRKPIYVESYQQKFMIENKMTRTVLEESSEGTLKMGKWANRDSQLWALDSHDTSGYAIVNVQSGGTLTYSENGEDFQIWSLSTQGKTFIQVEGRNIFLISKSGKPVYNAYKLYDGSDMWSLVEQESNTDKRIYVEDGQDKYEYVIENVNTGMILTQEEQYTFEEWQNKDSQLWTLEPQNKSGHSIIRNLATGVDIFCLDDDDISQNIWKLNIKGDTQIRMDYPNTLLTQENNSLMCIYGESTEQNDKWLFTERSKKANMKFLIKNKKTSMVLEEAEDAIRMGEWRYRISQMWTLKPQDKSGYFVVNVASGKALTYSKNDTDFDLWKLNTKSDTRIHIENANVILADVNGNVACLDHKENDESDKWLLIEEELEVNAKPKPIYIEDHQEIFVIQNKKTGRVLDVPNRFLKMREWENKNSQLWTLEADGFEHYLIRNVANEGVLSYLKEGKEYKLWNLDISSNTSLKVEGTDVVLSDKDGAAEFTEEQNDDSDRWMLVDEVSRKRNAKLKSIFVET
ncbi:uncharacterized protein LOC108908500 [Anoplophora glabripennis]|uniref:uncharacterized protein LOC108908500 n=1 Tax=Anoplophora glabripennis TaxID=217634 RepID=UPI000C75B37E|nr:uncharacterized protein LOC108908500 [Anoplophora glabripennis]